MLRISMLRISIAAVALAAGVIGAPRVQAQSAAGPVADAIAPRLQRPDATVPAAPAATMMESSRPFGLPQTLMIVGGAALLTGAIIGGDAGTVMMVGGAGVGLYGLYLFLREPSMGGGSGKAGLGLGYRLGT